MKRGIRFITPITFCLAGLPLRFELTREQLDTGGQTGVAASPSPGIPEGGAVNTCGPATDQAKAKSDPIGDRRTRILKEMRLRLVSSYNISIDQNGDGDGAVDRQRLGLLHNEMAQIYDHHIAPILKELDRLKADNDGVTSKLKLKPDTPIEVVLDTIQSLKQHAERYRESCADRGIVKLSKTEYERLLKIERGHELDKDRARCLYLAVEEQRGLIDALELKVQKADEYHGELLALSAALGRAGTEHDIRWMVREIQRLKDAAEPAPGSAHNSRVKTIVHIGEALQVLTPYEERSMIQEIKRLQEAAKPTYGISPLTMALATYREQNKLVDMAVKENAQLRGDHEALRQQLAEVLQQEIGPTNADIIQAAWGMRQSLMDSKTGHADTVKEPLTIGAPFGGGFFVGEKTVNGERFAMIVSPKAEGEALGFQYKNKDLQTTDGAGSTDNGLANSEHINDANHPAAQFCRGLQIGGFNDWYLPSKEELVLIYRNLGPGRETTPELFREGTAEAFEASWYWSSTEHASYSDLAWFVVFDAGTQGSNVKGTKFGVRAVRRLPL